MSGDDLYRDPELYDLEYDDLVEDVAHYVRLAVAARGPVLELGCGTGRLTLPIARAGAHVRGLDAAPAMLDRLRERLRNEPADIQSRVDVRRGDFRFLPTDAPVALALLPFNALHHCASHHDVLDLLRGVRANLLPGGRFALDCYLPDPELYARDPNVRHDERVFVDPRTGESLRSWESGSYDALHQVHEVVYTYQYPSGHERRVALRLRMFYPQELRALFEWGGFRIVHEAEDFDGSPLGPHSLKWVGILEPSP